MAKEEATLSRLAIHKKIGAHAAVIKDWLLEQIQKGKRQLLINIFFFLLIIFILLNFAQIKQVGGLFKHIIWYWFVIALFSQFLNFFSFALHIKEVLKKVNEKVSLWFLTKLVIAMQFVDTIVPSQRIGGHIFIFKSLRQKVASKPKRSFTIFVSGIANFGVDFLIFVVATIYAFFFIKASIIRILLLIFTGIFFILYVPISPFFFSSKGKPYVIAFFRKIPKKWLDRIIVNFSERAEGVFRGYYRAKRNIKAKDWFMPFFFMFLNRVFLYITLFFVVLSFNQYVSLDKLIIAEIVTAGIAFFSYIKIGFFEGALALTLSALGISYELAVTSTIIFRLLNLWIPTIIGFFFFRGLMKEKQK
ncbi:MAG: lysylphosphatidylglycerol synthase transmembrane domain-containing protein [Candidatus Pacearchaeota archaeon]